jgi:quinone-modifying oxidoreductase subunit QmoC
MLVRRDAPYGLRMSDPQIVKPDRKFLHRILEQGGEDLKKCYQCATCSVVCELSSVRKPFPRKEMIWSQWGLKDRLMADPDVWLCHQCNDCSTRCPRGARPGDVLAAVRQQAVEHYSVPKILGSCVNQIKLVPLLLIIPAVLLGLALLARGPIESAIHFHDHPGFYSGFVPHWLLIGFFSTLTIITFLAGLLGVFRFWKAMAAADKASGEETPSLGIVPSAIKTVVSILTHNKFSKCTDQAARRIAHLTAFYGFIALFIVTVWAVIDIYVNPLLGIDSMYPFGLIHPMKILANIGCVALIFGCTKALMDRKAKQEGTSASTPFDMIFVWLLLAVGVSGLFTEILRFAADPGAEGANGGLQYFAFAVYFAHLVLVFDLLVFLPYSKFAHILYRTAALVYAEHTGRNQDMIQAKQPQCCSGTCEQEAKA